MTCNNKKPNLDKCTCSYPGCSRKGICCDCLHYHLSSNEIPGCFFPPDAEKTYDRSIDYFISVSQGKFSK
ncbi:MAG: DUF6485 family protein [Candidatus Omnitrophota bacterium]